MPLASRAAPRKRSRAGCYTCRVRKVRCEALSRQQSSPANGGGGASLSDCANCKRLGFQCRWQPPASGEDYAPPPKRRRTIGRRGRAPESGDNETPPLESNVHDQERHQYETYASQQHVSTMLSTEHSHAFMNMEPANDGVNRPSHGFLDSDLNFNSGLLDLNLAGEGLDFIPLPVIDPSMLSNATQPTGSPSWPIEVEVPDMTEYHQSFHGQGQAFSTLKTSSSLSVNDDNRQLIQHYLEVMKGYSKIDERSKETSNLFISTFSQSLSFLPLFHAILAFSAAHLSLQDVSYVSQAAALDKVAAESFLLFQETHSDEIEGLLSALFVRIKKVHVMGDSADSFLELMAIAVDIVSSNRGREVLEKPPSLAHRIIIRLAILDARASCFRLGGGALIEQLRRLPSFSFIFSSETPNQTPPLGAVTNLLRANIFRLRVAELEAQLHLQLDSEFVTSPPVRTQTIMSLHADIRQEIDRWDQLISHSNKNQPKSSNSEGILDSTTYSSYAVLCALHSASLYLYHIFPLPSFNPEPSIAAILRYQLRVHHDDSRVESPSSILPSPLVLAGLVTDDPIHRDWIIKIFKGGEKWGGYIRKTRELLEALFRTQPTSGKLDICKVMDQVTGRFIV